MGLDVMFACCFWQLKAKRNYIEFVLLYIEIIFSPKDIRVPSNLSLLVMLTAIKIQSDTNRINFRVYVEKFQQKRFA